MEAHAVRIERIQEHEKPLLRNFMQAYRHDLSEFNGDEPDDDGRFSLGSYFEAYWTDDDRFPLKIIEGERPVGFALVRRISPGVHSIAEFFVLRAYRRSGVGRRAAIEIFNKLHGTWHVAQDEGNEPSQTFWRSVISEYTGDNFEEEWSESQPRGPMQVFKTR